MLATCYLDGTPIAPELTTADLGFVEAGALHVVGRADRVIITGGEKVQPAEVEGILVQTLGVRAACVFGVSDLRWGQLVAATVAVDQTFDLDAASAHWRTVLPAHALPRELAVVRTLPLLPSGKVDLAATTQLARIRVRYS
jgi:O-succinylbenzoic acid--CoA ligase